MADQERLIYVIGIDQHITLNICNKAEYTLQVVQPLAKAQSASF